MPTPHHVAPALACLAVAAIWIGLAVARPATTWHLAPALIVLAGPWADAQRSHPRPLPWTGLGVAISLGTTLLLHRLALLRGPSLAGPDVTAEAILATTLAALTTTVSTSSRPAWPRPRRRTSARRKCRR
jgi:hypothetical protein